MIDDRTPIVNLPLPNEDNFVLEDIPRLREAFGAIDTAIGALSTSVSEKSNSGHGHSISDISGLVLALDAKVSTSVNVVAGNGLTGGGTLGGNVTITLAPPGTLTTGTDNEVTEGSHTHAVTFPVTSVNSKSGSVSLTTQDISENGNLYFTGPRASAAAPVQSVAGRTGNVLLGKSDVGLGSVDNTSDAQKPISTAVQSALNAKAGTSSPTFSGVVNVKTDGSASEVVAEGAHGDGGAGGRVRMRSSRGTLASKAQVLDGDVVGETLFEAWDGGAWRTSAIIRAVIEGAAGAGDMPTSLVISTTPDGSSTPVERVRIKPNGQFIFKAATGNSIVAMGGGTVVDCSQGDYFVKTISGAFSPTFVNVPPGLLYGAVIKVTHNSGVITWPSSVRWVRNIAPAFTPGRTHLFGFLTDDGGLNWMGVTLPDFVVS